MILKFIDLILGSFGQYLQSIYTNHLLLVNGVVIGYAILIVIAHNNLRKTVVAFEKLALSLVGDSQLKEIDFEGLFVRTKQEWAKVGSGKKTLVTSTNDFWFEWVAQTDLIGLLELSPNYLKVALYKRTGKRDKAFFSSGMFLSLDEYRGNLLKGIRAKRKEPDMFKARMKDPQVTLGKKG